MILIPEDYGSDGYYSYEENNTVQIQGTEKTASAKVTVDYYAPIVSKTAIPAIEETTQVFIRV